MFSQLIMKRPQQRLQNKILGTLIKLSKMELYCAQTWGTQKSQHIFSLALSMPRAKTLAINGQQYRDVYPLGNNICQAFQPERLIGVNASPFQKYSDSFITAFSDCQFPRLRLALKTLFPLFNTTELITYEEIELGLYLYDRLHEDGELENLQSGPWIEDYATEISNKIGPFCGTFIDYRRPDGGLSRRAYIIDTPCGKVASGYNVYAKDGQSLILFERLPANMFFGQEKLAACPFLPVIITNDADFFYDNSNFPEAIVIGCFGDLETLKINDLDIFKGRSVHWALLSDTATENIKDTITVLELFEKADLRLSVVDFSSCFLPDVVASEKNKCPCNALPNAISTADVLMYADRFNIPVPEQLRPEFYGKIDLNRIHSNGSEEVEGIVSSGEIVLIEETSGVPLFLFSAALTAGVANEGNVLGHKLKNPQKKIQVFVMEDMLPKMAKKLSNTPNNFCYYKIPCSVNDMSAFITIALNKENASIVVFDSIFMKNDFEALRVLLAMLRRRKTTVFIIQNQSLNGTEEIPDYLRVLLDQRIRLLAHENKKDRLMLEILGDENEVRREAIEKLDTGWKIVETASAEDLAAFMNRTQTVEKDASERKYTL